MDGLWMVKGAFLLRHCIQKLIAGTKEGTPWIKTTPAWHYSSRELKLEKLSGRWGANAMVEKRAKIKSNGTCAVGGVREMEGEMPNEENNNRKAQGAVNCEISWAIFFNERNTGRLPPSGLMVVVQSLPPLQGVVVFPAFVALLKSTESFKSNLSLLFAHEANASGIT